jgi:hypothetical protein
MLEVRLDNKNKSILAFSRAGSQYNWEAFSIEKDPCKKLEHAR